MENRSTEPTTHDKYGRWHTRVHFGSCGFPCDEFSLSKLAHALQAHTHAVDVWSAGCCILELLLGRPFLTSCSSAPTLVSTCSTEEARDLRVQLLLAEIAEACWVHSPSDSSSCSSLGTGYRAIHTHQNHYIRDRQKNENTSTLTHIR